MNRPLKNGFTLPELLGSVAIIAISLAVCLPSPQGLEELDGAVVEDGPVSVRHFLCEYDGDVETFEAELRRALDSTPFEVCGVARDEAGGDTLFVGVWAPAAMQEDVLLGDLRTHLRGIEISSNSASRGAKGTRVASID